MLENNIDWIRQKLSLPGTEDLYFLLLRFFTVAGGIFWYFIAPYEPARREIIVWLLTIFTIYSLLLYVGISLRPKSIRAYYLTTLGVDLVFIFILVRYIEQLSGSFFIGFYLLVAIHSFYFGFKIGLGAALLSSILYSAAYFDLSGFSFVPWQDLLLRINFLFLIAVSLGFLAEREKKMRKRVEELNRELARKNSILEQTYRHLSIGKLIGEIAEGINGPCGIMASRSEILAQEAKERNLPQEFVTGLEVINKSSYKVAQVVRSLLTFSKQKSFEMKVLDFNQLVEETFLLMEKELKERNVKVEKVLMTDLPPILGDALELKGVLINLISNGIDALPQGGIIGIHTHAGSKDGGEVVCTVTDNGTGIPKEYLERIFNPFFTTKHNTEGIGLGLSTSLSVMKKHNGSITVNSRPGGGTAFSLSLPSSPS